MMNGKKDLKKMKTKVKKLPNWFFSIGRAGTYRYEVDIDDCIFQALEIKKIIEKNSWDGPIVGEEFKIKL